MGYFKSLWNAIQGKEVVSTSQVVKPTGYETGYETSFLPYGTGISSKQREYLQEMKGWVFSCVTSISDEIASIDLKLYRQLSGKIEEVTDHPILDSLYKVNNYTTKFDHFWLTSSYMELTGECPWFLDKENGQIKGIYILQPSKITPIPDKQKIIQGYSYELDHGKRITIPPDELIFLKFPNPSNPFRGLGTLQAAARTVDIDNYSEEWNAKFYENSARPDIVIKVKGETLTKEQKEKVKASILKSYQGVDKSHGVAVLFGDMELDKFGFNQKDMDFLEQQKFSRDKILGVFRVPKAIVAQTEGVNFASADVAQYVFTARTIKPKMERLIQQLNEFYVPLFPDGQNLFLDYEDPVPSNSEQKLMTYDNAIKNGWMTINEVREAENLEPIEGGDRPLVSTMMVPLGGVPEQPTKPTSPTQTPPENAPLPEETPQKIHKDRFNQLQARSKWFLKWQKTRAELKQKIKEQLREEIKTMKVKAKIQIAEKKDSLNQWNEEQKQLFWTTKNNIFTTYLPKVETALRKVFKMQRNEILVKLDKSKGMKASIDVKKLLLKAREQEKRLAITVQPILEDLFKEAGDETFAFLGVEMSIDVSSGSVAKLIKAGTRLLAKGTTDTTNQKITTAVTEGLAANLSIEEIGKQISDVFTEATEVRANLIARTETIKYNVRATEESFMESGVVEAKQWVVDGSPCDRCISMNGKIAGLGDNYIDQGGKDPLGNLIDYEAVGGPPLHPNCMCDLAPIFIETRSADSKKRSLRNYKIIKSGIKLKNEAQLIKENIKKLEAQIASQKEDDKSKQ